MPLELFPKDDEKREDDLWVDETQMRDDPIFYLPYTPESVDDSMRRTGLAWSLGIAFFISVGVSLFLGWLADLFLGSSPWGLVGGILLGAILGFIQFYRITSQIFPTKKDGPAVRPLMQSDEEERRRR